MAKGADPSGDVMDLYIQPEGPLDAPILKRVFSNPNPWPVPDIANETCSVFWQHGHPDTKLLTPVPPHQSLSSWTGLAVDADEEVVTVHTTSSRMPWSGVQYSNRGIWGAALNTTNATEYLTTTTLESKFRKSQECIDIWSSGANLRVELKLAVPYAFKLSKNDSCAVYTSLSVYLSSKASEGHPFGEHFIWYTAGLFDFERDVSTDHVFIDIPSQRLIIQPSVTESSLYLRKMPSSFLTSNTTWVTPRMFAYEITAQHVENGIRDGLKQFPKHFPKSLPKEASSWCVTGFNIELEATPDAGAGVTMQDLRIAKVKSEIGIIV